MVSINDRTQLVKKEIVQAISELLVSHGFETAVDFRVNGLSGYNHRFDLFAQRGESRLLIEVPEDVFGVLASLAKRVDVRGFDFLITARRDLIRGILREVEVPEGEMLKRATIIVFDVVDDLLRRLQEFLAARTALPR